MFLYKPGDPVHEALAVDWWGKLTQSGDAERLFWERPLALSGLFERLSMPGRVVLMEATPEEGVWFLAWFEPWYSQVSFGVWISPKRRRTKAGLGAFLEAASAGLAQYDVLASITAHKELLALHRRLGYEVSGELPGFWHGQTAWLVVLTRTAFEARRAHYERRSRRGSEQVVE